MLHSVFGQQTRYSLCLCQREVSSWEPIATFCIRPRGGARSVERLTGSVLPAKHGAWVTTAAGSVLRCSARPLQHVGKLKCCSSWRYGRVFRYVGCGGGRHAARWLWSVDGGARYALSGSSSGCWKGRNLDRRGRLLVTSFDNRLVRLGPARTQSESFSLTRQPVPSASPTHARPWWRSAPRRWLAKGKVALARRDGRPSWSAARGKSSSRCLVASVPWGFCHCLQTGWCSPAVAARSWLGRLRPWWRPSGRSRPSVSRHGLRRR